MQAEEVLFHFAAKLETLKDWPDKAIIMELTAFTEASIAIAPHFVNIIVEKLVNAKTNSAYKLPLFYLVDSIMKHVGGPYAALFGKLFSEAYIYALHDIHEKDCPKLEFLLTTWDERKLLPTDLILSMKAHIGNRAIPQKPFRSFPAVSSNMPVPASGSRGPVSHNFPELSTNNSYNRAAPGVVGADPNFSTQAYADLVQSEMVNFLNQLYREMNITEPLSLQELANANPELFEKIRLQAEENANAMLAMRQVNSNSSFREQPAVLPVQSSYPLQPSYANPVVDGESLRPRKQFDDQQQQMEIQLKVQRQLDSIQQHIQSKPRKQAVSTMDDGYVKKRRTDFPGSGDWGSFPLAPGLSGDGWNRAQQPQYSNRYSGRGALGGPTHAGGRGRGHESSVGPYDRDRDRERDLYRERNRDFQAAPHNPAPSQDRPNDSAVSEFDESAAKLLQAKLFVNGFVCETPVVVDIDRVSTLLQRLSHAGALLNGQQATDKIASRLKGLLDNVDIPPTLPPILFGPLPLEPLIAKKNDRRNGVSEKSKAPARKLLPVPPFRVDELGRNPDFMLRALYSDRPHQYHEDGLRFKTLVMLQEHTNAFLERKKLLLRKKEGSSVRECREWYCTAAQWITDFNRLSVSSQGTSNSGGREQQQAGEKQQQQQQQQQMQQQEQFIVPADEHFTRCPVSREVFEAFFDEEEGEFMYRNAARLLVTKAADSALFNLGRETENKVPDVRYLIVHKLLVLDSLLQSGKATSLSEALQRYQAAGARVPAALEVAERLRAAAGEEENEDDVFVMLDLFS